MKRVLICIFLWLMIQAAFFVPMTLWTIDSFASWDNMIHNTWSVVTVVPTGKAITDVHEKISEEVAYSFNGVSKTQYVEANDPTKSTAVDTNPIQLYINNHTGAVEDQGWTPEDNIDKPGLAPLLLIFLGLLLIVGSSWLVFVFEENWDNIFRTKLKFSKADKQLYQYHKEDMIKQLAYESAKKELEEL